MKQYDHPTATVDGEFTDGNPANPVLEPPTIMVADWPNLIQRELVALVEGAGLALDAFDDTQVLQAVQEIAGSGAGQALHRNALINGAFELWQRGTSFAVGTGQNVYTADRWAVVGPSSGTVTVSKVTLDPTAITAVDTHVPREALDAMRVVVLGPGTDSRIEQRIEYPHRFRATTVTFAVSHRLNLPNADHAYGFTLRVRLWDGAAFTTLGTQAVSVGTGGDVQWRRSAVTVAVPDFEGLTLTGTPYLSVEIVNSAGADTAGFLLAVAQCERAAVPTPFEWREPSTEYSLAARYYTKSYPLDRAPGATGGGSPLSGAPIGFAAASNVLLMLASRFPVPMRITPTVQWYSPNAGTAARVDVNGAPFPFTTPGAASAVATGFPELAAPATAGHAVVAHWTADAEI